MLIYLLKVHNVLYLKYIYFFNIRATPEKQKGVDHSQNVFYASLPSKIEVGHTFTSSKLKYTVTCSPQFKSKLPLIILPSGISYQPAFPLPKFKWLDPFSKLK